MSTNQSPPEHGHRVRPPIPRCRRRAFLRHRPLLLRRGRRPEDALAEEGGPEVGREEGVEDGVEARVEVGEAVRHDLQHDERRAADVVQVEFPQEQDHLRKKFTVTNFGPRSGYRKIVETRHANDFESC